MRQLTSLRASAKRKRALDPDRTCGTCLPAHVSLLLLLVTRIGHFRRSINPIRQKSNSCSEIYFAVVAHRIMTWIEYPSNRNTRDHVRNSEICRSLQSEACQSLRYDYDKGGYAILGIHKGLKKMASPSITEVSLTFAQVRTYSCMAMERPLYDYQHVMRYQRETFVANDTAAV